MGPYLVGPPFKENFGKGLESTLTDKLGVKVILNDRVDIDIVTTGPIPKQTFKTDAGKAIQADFILIGSGNKPNNNLVKDYLPELLTDQGRIKVKPTLQIDTEDSNLQNIFVIGDIADTQASKTGAEAHRQADVVANNIILSIRKGKLKEFQPGPTIMAVSLGPNNGQSALPLGVTVGGLLTKTVKSKTLFLSEYRNRFG